MPHILMLTNAQGSSVAVLPALEFLRHQIHILPARASVLPAAESADLVLVDARRDLGAARSLTLLLTGSGIDAAVLPVLTEGGMAAVSADWGVDDVILAEAPPAEVEARLRLALGRRRAADADASPEISAAGIVINEHSYTATVNGAVLNLTYKEFELLKYLVQNPGRVFSRDQLLQEVWGYDYFGGARTVDVHIRRLRAKLGSDHEQLIITVRNVGYQLSEPQG